MTAAFEKATPGPAASVLSAGPLPARTPEASGGRDGSLPAAKSDRLDRRHTPNLWDEQRARRWADYRPPARPSAGELAVYDARLRGAEGTVGILGSTPELRALAHRHGRRTICVDASREVFAALEKLVECRGAEEFIHADWRELRCHALVDVVLADGSINMVPASEHGLVLRNIHGALRDGGTAVMRAHVVRPVRYTSADQVVTQYRLTGQGECFWTWTRTYLDMLWKDANHAVAFLRYHEQVRALRERGVLTAQEYESYHRLEDTNAITLYYAEPQAFESLVQRFFDILAVDYGGDYEGCMHHPIYLLRKRKSGAVR